MILLITLYILSFFMIFWANIGYPLFIILLGKIIKRKNKKDYSYNPTVTLMIVAHNEEKVIEEKLKNAVSMNYSIDKYSIIVTSDNSDDKTNEIVEKFIEKNKKYDISLYTVKKRQGKTNAQNEAAKLVKSEILVMTDANSILEKNAIKELVSSFTDENIAYVTGKLIYTNGDMSETSSSESSYWNLDTKIREIESNIQTITAGNGALYACRTKEYHDFKPIRCHDSAMPLYYSLNKKRAIANHNAIAYEKAGETNNDEFKRKVRMNRGIVYYTFPSIKLLNIFKYKWFSVFYFGHRTARYLLWLNHFILLVTNIVLCQKHIVFSIILGMQIIIYLMAIIKNIFKINNKLFNFTGYYCMTVLAQVVGVWKTITGKNKPFWEKAETTR